MLVIRLSELLLLYKDKQLIISNPKHFIATIKIHSIFSSLLIFKPGLCNTPLYTVESHRAYWKL